MTVFVVDGLRVGFLKFESDTPVTANPDCSCPLAGTPEWMKAKALKSHISRRRRRIESAQYQSLGMLSLNLNSGYSLKKASQTLMLKASEVQIVDRLADRYFERVVDPDAGEVLRECDEPLSQHTGRGSAKQKRRK